MIHTDNDAKAEMDGFYSQLKVAKVLSANLLDFICIFRKIQESGESRRRIRVIKRRQSSLCACHED